MEITMQDALFGASNNYGSLLGLLNIGVWLGIMFFMLIFSFGYTRNYTFFIYALIYFLLISTPYLGYFLEKHEIVFNQLDYLIFLSFLFAYYIKKSIVLIFSNINTENKIYEKNLTFILYLISIIFSWFISNKIFYFLCIIGVLYLSFTNLNIFFKYAKNTKHSRLLIIFGILYFISSIISFSSFTKTIVTATFTTIVITAISNIITSIFSILLFAVFQSKNSNLQQQNIQKIIAMEKERKLLLISQNEMIETQLKERTKKLEDLIKIKNWYLGIISHDLRNPINEVIIIINRIAEANAKLKFDRQIEKLQLINETFLMFLRWVESNEKDPKIHINYLPVKSTIENIIAEFDEVLKKKSITIINNIGNENKVRFYLPFFETIIRNTLSNAIKYSYEAGYIRVWMEDTDQYNKLMIRDTGIGIEQNEIDEIFNNPTRKLGTYYETSTGFGLFICKDIIENFDGNMTINSQKEIGTTVCISLKK